MLEADVRTRGSLKKTYTHILNCLLAVYALFSFWFRILANTAPQPTGELLNSTNCYTLYRPCAQPLLVSYKEFAYTTMFAWKCPHRNLDIVNANRRLDCKVKSHGVANKLLLVCSGVDMPPRAIYSSMKFSSLVHSCYY